LKRTKLERHCFPRLLRRFDEVDADFFLLKKTTKGDKHIDTGKQAGLARLEVSEQGQQQLNDFECLHPINSRKISEVFPSGPDLPSAP